MLQAYEEDTNPPKLSQPPKLIVVIVIDQFAHHYLPKLSPYFRDGLKLLMSRGICYENAHHPTEPLQQLLVTPVSVRAPSPMIMV